MPVLGLAHMPRLAGALFSPLWTATVRQLMHPPDCIIVKHAPGTCARTPAAQVIIPPGRSAGSVWHTRATCRVGGGGYARSVFALRMVIISLCSQQQLAAGSLYSLFIALRIHVHNPTQRQKHQLTQILSSLSASVKKREGVGARVRASQICSTSESPVPCPMLTFWHILHPASHWLVLDLPIMRAPSADADLAPPGPLPSPT
jgi:hypothetical protein